MKNFKAVKSCNENLLGNWRGNPESQKKTLESMNDFPKFCEFLKFWYMKLYNIDTYIEYSDNQKSHKDDYIV